MKNISELHVSDKNVSAQALFKGEIGTATAIRLLANSTLKEHITQTPALLICISGEVTYENETAEKHTLSAGDFISIPPQIKHWLVATKDSQLILLK